jgi:hypothetical protein
MDKTRQYIQMCQRSKEIQGLWTPRTGDFYADPNMKVRCWIPDSAPYRTIRKGFAIRTTGNLTRLIPLVWMPKLDQLIEISQIRGKGFRDMSFVFYEWVKEPYGEDGRPANRQFASLEQLWLAFIMNRKHLKHWQDDHWAALRRYS